jgi:dihydrodipicolinate synthase/N-acetylneuraminate lyase
MAHIISQEPFPRLVELEQYHPKRGLSIPSITVLDGKGNIIEEDQRRLFRYNIQDGCGANIIFGVGTNGEWNRLSNERRQEVMRIEVDEVRTVNEELVRKGHSRVEAWVGVTGNTKQETLENIRAAIRLGADAGVVAPLSIIDLGETEIVNFFHREITPLIERESSYLPVFLYDNAEIAVNHKIPHIRTRIVKQLSRLNYLVGIKVSASKKVLGNYIKASSHFKHKEEFGFYIGNAILTFDIYKRKSGLGRMISEYRNRRLLRNELPIGVVSGPANLLPREWQKAWRVCYAGDETLMEKYRYAFTLFEDACKFAERGRVVYKGIACIKYALYLEGVISSYQVGKGTAELTVEQKKMFEEKHKQMKEYLVSHTDTWWISRK